MARKALIERKGFSLWPDQGQEEIKEHNKALHNYFSKARFWKKCECNRYQVIMNIKTNWPKLLIVAIPVATVFTFGKCVCLSDSQAVIFSSSAFMFIEWILSCTGNSTLPSLDSTPAKLIISVAFTTGATLAFVPEILSGGHYIEWTLAFALSVFIFLPYGVSALFDVCSK